MKTFILILGLAFSGLAWGQAGELWFNFGDSLLSDTGLGTNSAFGGSPNDLALTDGWRFSLRFGFNQGDHYGHEIQYAYNHTNLKLNYAGGQELGMHFHQGGYNFLYYPFTTAGARIRPFGTGGVQFDNFVEPGGNIYQGSSNKFGANFGAGVKVHVHGIWAARLDLREYVSPKPSFGFALKSGALWQTEISAGVGVGF